MINSATAGLRISLGFFVSVVVGDLVISPIIVKYCWPRLVKHHKVTAGKGTFSREVGWLERLMYTGAIYCGAWQWIGVWMAVKVAARWRSTAGDTAAPVDNVWLLGSGLSILFGFLGAWVALGHLPIMK
jgi:hypothetical protein